MMRTIARVVTTVALTAALSAVPACSTPQPGAPAMAPMARCQAEDGSTPGQPFPCVWDARARGNGQGDSFILPAPIVALADV